MVHEDPTSPKGIERAGTPEPRVRVVIEDEMELVLKGVREAEEAERIKLFMEPRRPYPRSARM